MHRPDEGRRSGRHRFRRGILKKKHQVQYPNLNIKSKAMRTSLLRDILDLFFPRTCAICGNVLAGGEEMICIKCLFRMPGTDTWKQPYDNEMAKLFWHLIPIERCCALFHHISHATSARAVYQLKYMHHPEMGIYLGRMLAKKGLGIQFFDGIDAIIPIPLTRKREKERGYNQSFLIAKGIQQLTHLTIIKDAVRRKKFSESQTHKNRQERLENVSQVFEAAATYHDGQGEHPITQLEGKHILIIDDVCTTGATIISCAETLIKAAGKMKISVLTVGFAHD